MKIGIITLSFHINYGGLLQAFALKQILKQMENDVEFLEFGPYYGRGQLRRLLSRIKQSIIKFISYSEKKANDSYIRQHTDNFIKRYLFPIFVIDSKKQFQQAKFDAIIVGSDQIWRGENYYNLDHAFLMFANKCKLKRISYGASFGNDISKLKYTVTQIEKYKKQIKIFDFISVREYSGVKICKDLFNTNATCVLDPTMLLRADQYIKLFNLNKKREHNGLYTYILDPSEKKELIIDKISQKLNISSYSIYTPQCSTLENSFGEKRIPSVESWLKGFVDADYIITDSFHGIVFSILFNKPFWVFINESRGATRFDTILRRFELTERIINSSINIEKLNNKIIEPIHWDNIQEKLEKYRVESMQIFYKL